MLLLKHVAVPLSKILFQRGSPHLHFMIRQETSQGIVTEAMREMGVTFKI